MINIFETSFEARERRFQIERLYHGETVDLVGVVTTDGVPQNITGYSVSGVFQPTSMNGSPDFYELSADIVDNRVIVHWEKGKDFGENSYMVWALLTDGDNVSYPIAWRLDMAYSPSYPLSDLAPIPKAIDFSKYDLLNAPWLPLSDVQSLEENVLLSVAEGFLPLSGGTIDGSLNVTREISAENFTAKSGVGINIGGNTVSDNAVVIGVNSMAKYGSVGIGNGIQSDGFSNVNIGLASKATGDYGIAFGQNTEVSSHGIAVGYGAKATDAGSIALGVGTRSTALNAIQLGSMMVDDSGWNEQVNTTPHSLKVMDKMVLSGDNLTLDPERIPYLSDYAKTEDIPEVPTDLSAFTNSPGYLTAHQSLEDYYTKQEADDKFLTAHQDLTDYATKTYVQEYVDEHGGGTPANMSACLSSDEFNKVNDLSFSESEISVVVAKINEILNTLKRIQLLPYISNGLIAWWDGIWNNGMNNHSDSTTIWKDLKGNNDLTYGGNPAGKWDPNSFTFNKTYTFYSTTSTINSQTRNGFTAEFVYNLASQIASNYTGTFGARNGGASDGIYGLNYFSGTGGLGCGLGNGTDFNTTTAPALTALNTINTIHYMAITFDGSQLKLYHNGELVATKSAEFSGEVTTCYLLGRGYVNNNDECLQSISNRTMDGKVFAHRIYARELTATEIANNYQVDAQRFNIA